MELTKTKFKHTEVGLIPEDWNIYSLQELGEFKNGINKPKEDFGFGSPFVNLMDVFGKPQIDTQVELELINSNKEEKSLYSLKKGDVIFVRSSVKPSGVGLTTVVTEDLIDTVFSGFLIRFRLNKPINDLYKKYCFHEKQFRDRLIASSSVSANTNINQDALKTLKIPLPPTLTEQKAIATTLSDVDELIGSLEKLIAKKKAIKQGAMQQLLTPPHKGGKRLPGFSGEWEEKRLGEVANIKTGSRNNQDKVEEGLYPFFVRSQTVERINSYSYNCEAILVPGEGGIGSIFHYINGKFEVHQRVYKISDFIINVFGKYIYLQMKHSFGKHAMANTVKATVDSLRLPTFEEFVVPIPPTIEEQKAIAQILSDMDLEIEALEAKKDKYQSIKQGMMQELLTGKTRLI